jgi:hypothetical protein
MPIKINHNEDVTLRLARNSLSKSKLINDQPMKISDVISEPQDSKKSFQGQSRSRACELL